MSCTKIVFIALNVFIFLAGATSFIAGMIWKFGSGVLQDEVVKLLNQIYLDSVPIGNLGEAMFYLMVVAGALIMVIAVLGICAAFCGNKGCLIAYIVILIILIILDLILFGLWIYMRQTENDWFTEKLMGQLADFEGPEAEDDKSKGWNKLFIKAKCCGVNEQYKDGGTNNDFETKPAKWWANRGSDYVPASCCEKATESTVKDYVGSADCTASNPPKNYHKKGCDEAIKETVDSYSLLMIIIVAIATLVEIIAIIFAVLVMKKGKSTLV